ncbi:MAG TPA: adenosine deaminase, partial [Anaeromyxobacteraceae bacterium]|nr:adenosine deaminase [Anaeromyxobacteraceae bacterium]
VAIRAVLGQQVSVRGATTLAARLVAAFGEPLDGATPPLGRLFPGAARLAGARVEEVRGLGMPEARARTIVELSRALAEGRVDLSAGADPERAVAALLALPGVGPWTAQYLAMRALRWPDAFPAGDLGVRRALGLDAVRDVEARARGWSPWRAYAVMHLWCE